MNVMAEQNYRQAYVVQERVTGRHRVIYVETGKNMAKVQWSLNLPANNMDFENIDTLDRHIQTDYSCTIVNKYSMNYLSDAHVLSKELNRNLELTELYGRIMVRFDRGNEYVYLSGTAKPDSATVRTNLIAISEGNDNDRLFTDTESRNDALAFIEELNRIMAN